MPPYLSKQFQSGCCRRKPSGSSHLAEIPVLMRAEAVGHAGHARGITRSSEWYSIEPVIKSLPPS